MKMTMIGAALALSMISAPALATDFSLQSGINTEGNGWFVAPHISNGGYQWNPTKGITEILPVSFDHTLKFNIGVDSLVKISLWQSEAGITFTDILFNGVSIVQNLTGIIGSNPGFNIGSEYATAGQVTLQFIGTNYGNPHSFGGNINVTAGTRPLPPVTAPVPEPASWAMMIAGLGAVGYSLRARRSQMRVQFM